MSLPTNRKGHCLCKTQNFKKFSVTLPILPFPVFYITRTFEKLSLYKLNMRPNCYNTVHTAQAAKAVQTIRRGHKIMVHWTTTSRTGEPRIRTQIKNIIERSETNWKKVTDDLLLWHFLGITFCNSKIIWRHFEPNICQLYKKIFRTFAKYFCLHYT